MKVIYDISVLGKGFYTQRARTGIFRVVENLACELVKMRSALLFSSTLSINSYFESLDYLQSNKYLEDIPLAKPDVCEATLKLCQFLHAGAQKNNVDSLFDIENKLLTISGRKILCRKSINLANSIFQQKTINNEALQKANIFHSPFFPFPHQIKINKKLQKVITIYDLIPILYSEYFQFKENELIHRIIKCIDDGTWIICISHATKNDLCNYVPSIDSSRVFVTHLAASELFFNCQNISLIERQRKKNGIPDGYYVLSLSTLEPRKNIELTIKCFSRLVKEEGIKDLSLVLVGAKGWDFDDIFNSIAASPEIRDRIIVTGYLPDGDLAPLYSGAMMFVYPSFYEGFGLPPLEAMQCGVPVITSNTSSLPEVVGNAGMMVAPEDADGLCQAMLDIYKSSELRQEMSKDSLEQAKKFSWEKCAEQTIDVYKKALA